MNSTLLNVTCIWFLLFLEERGEKIPWVGSSWYLSWTQSRKRGQEWNISPQGEFWVMVSCMTQKSSIFQIRKHQQPSKCQLCGFFFWNLLLRNPGSLQEPTFLYVTMSISLWLFLLRNFIDDLSVSKPMSKQRPKYPCQILFSCKTASFLISVALEAPTFPPLSLVPAITPAAEVSAGVCARAEPRWGWQLLLWHMEPVSASRLKPSETENEESSAQGGGWISFGLKEAFGDSFYKQHTTCTFQSLDDTG